MTVDSTSARSVHITRRSLSSARRRGIQFVRRTCLGGLVATSIFAAGETTKVVAQDLVLPPDLTIGMRTITNNVLLGSYYDAPGNPPETSFDTLEELRALEAQYVAGMVPLIQSDLNVDLNFDQAAGNNPPFFPHNTNDSLASVWSGELVV